jgi:hypothetical protein
MLDRLTGAETPSFLKETLCGIKDDGSSAPRGATLQTHCRARTLPSVDPRRLLITLGYAGAEAIRRRRR